MKNLALTFILLFLVKMGAQAQISDSLASCKRNINLLIVKADKPTSLNRNDTDVQAVFYSGFNAFRSHDTNSSTSAGLFNAKYQRLELRNSFSVSLPSLRYYRISYNNVILYIGNSQLNQFIAELLKKSEKLSLTRYFSSVAYNQFAVDFKKKESILDNNCCFQYLVLTDKPDLKTSVALTNIILQLPNNGKITHVQDNRIIFSPVGKADFMEDFEYYILGKPDLRVKITTVSAGTIIALVYDSKEGKATDLTTKDVVTSIVQ